MFKIVLTINLTHKHEINLVYSLLEVVSDLQNLPFFGFLGRFFYGQYFSPTVIESYVSLSTLPVPYGSGTPVYKPLLLE